MGLLERNSDDQLCLTKDLLDDIPPYAILSHTWGADTEEVTFQDLMNHTGGDKLGYEKIRFCGRQASRDGLRYFWVDTCCIDKTNNTELAEAINSMFCWYRNATKCYVYLSDVLTSVHDQTDPSLQSWQSTFRKSRWFTRGWTLQELIAPQSVEFFCSGGTRLGDKHSLEQQLHEITGIAIQALRGTSLSAISVYDRMLWAKNRETKREEDMAYSLLGIFDVSMPLVYSEGAERALERLRGELLMRSQKHSLDELSPVSYNSVKRLKTICSHPLPVPSGLNSNFLGPRQPIYSEHDTPPEIGPEQVYSMDATTKQSLIDQLYFTKIDERLISLTAAQGTTCRWFLTKPEYTSWQDVMQQSAHGGFLWIRGHPGTGKSTLMKLLFEEAKLNNRAHSSKITLSFFFLARGTVEEKSTAGLYRSLLHQLLEKAKDLRDSLEWMTVDGARVIQRNGWHEEALKQTLTHAVRKLGSRSLTIFVDALDECNKSQVTGMVFFFEDLCNHASQAHIRLQICFSSRHYPTINIEKCIKVTLEDEIGHTKDIEQYIKSKLRLGKSKQAESIRSEILEKSSRIFLWVVLVLDILNSEYTDSSISIKQIRERLKDIPPKLADLFEMILTRDGENLERLQICLKWILFATRPLKPQELYFAIQLNLDKKCSGCWDQDDVELDRMKTFVRNSSKGLAEVTRNKAAEVQFIHESIRDFLLGKYEGQWSGATGNFVGHSHEILKSCCLTQLNSIIYGVDIPDPLPPAPKTSPLRDTICLKFPFLEYSVSNILCHANSAQQNTIEQGDFLASFPLQEWILLNNTLERHNIRRYTKSVSLVYICAEKNLANLIRIHPQRAFCFHVENERYGLPILAALANGSYKAIQTFMEAQAEIHPQKVQIHRLCKQYSENRNKRMNISRYFTFSQERRSVCSYFAEHGDEVILTLFCALGKLDADSQDKDGRTPLWWAAKHGHEAVVKLLLAIEGINADSKDKDGRTPLWWAAECGHEAVVKLLLATEGVNADSHDWGGWTPLSRAAMNGHEAMVKLLLATEGVDADS